MPRFAWSQVCGKKVTFIVELRAFWLTPMGNFVFSAIYGPWRSWARSLSPLNSRFRINGAYLYFFLTTTEPIPINTSSLMTRFSLMDTPGAIQHR
ncbi:MAG: hypothetical protein NT004_11000 [Bacteroidetes bacterium]|nr:hypothetical protein [Bacteroidota bacterium]